MRLEQLRDEGGLVPVGRLGGLFPERVHVRTGGLPGDPPDAPVVEFTIVVEDGRVGCTCVSVNAKDGQPPLSASSLRGVRLGVMFDEVLRELLQIETDAGFLTDAPAPVLQEVIGAVHRRRNQKTPSRLREVAAAYEDGGPKEVERRLHVSESQAHRLSKEAEEAGLMQRQRSSQPKPTRTKGKKR